MKKIKFNIVQLILLSLIIGIAVAMYVHVSSVKEKLDNIQNDLIYVEAGRITRDEAPYLNKYNIALGETSNTIQPQGAYLLAAPYIVIDLALILVYIVKYRT